MVENCDQHAINSHLLQQNGILNTIAEDNHVIEVKEIDSYKWDEKSPPIKFETVGIKSALSLKLFCSKHDSQIFHPAENKSVDFDSYQVHLLLSYRTICAEIRKKEHVNEVHRRLLNSNTLANQLPEQKLIDSINGTLQGIEDLLYYKRKCEQELNDGHQKKFKFKVYDYPLIKVYCSASFNIYESIHTPYEEDPLKYIFTHIIPYGDSLKVIVGYHEEQVKDSIIKYVDSWGNLSLTELETKLTDLFSTYVENWGMSPDIYRNLNKETEKRFIKHFADTLNHTEHLNVDFNLFEGDNHGTHD